MKSVLIIITTSFEKTGGLTTVMMNYYRNMVKDDITIDFASTNEASSELVEELNKNGSHYYCLGNRKRRLLVYVTNLRTVLKNHSYDVVHINGNSATMCFESRTARREGVKKIICHTHTSKSEYPFFDMILRPFFKNSYDKALAVSSIAGNWLFGKNYEILNNAIEISKYVYNENIRNKIRKDNNIEDQYVIGTVGKLTQSKNHSFLLRTFAEYQKNNINSTLMIVGGGELEHELKLLAKTLGIDGSVIFLGMREDVDQILQCFDCFVFTSTYEGFGMALLEAQAAGLYCVSSDKVPKETMVTSNIEYLSLLAPEKKWAKKIEKVRQIQTDRRQRSEDALKSIARHGFDIENEAKKLKEIYLNS